MQNKFVLISTFLLLSLISQAQTITYYINSGPSTFVSFDYSANIAGPGWNTPSYNDSAWLTPYNGSGQQGSSFTCAGPDQSAYGTGPDTMIWSSPTTLAPDTACFRHKLSLPKCGTVTSATFQLAADDYFFFYINDYFIETNFNMSSNQGLVLNLDTNQLTAFNYGENVLAAQVVNASPSCGYYSLISSITVDTTGCFAAGINEINSDNISVSPNPATNKLSVTISGQSQSCTITMYDMIGNEVLTQNTSGANTSIDISTLSKGIYNLQLVDNNGHVTNKRVVKE